MNNADNRLAGLGPNFAMQQFFDNNAMKRVGIIRLRRVHLDAFEPKRCLVARASCDPFGAENPDPLALIGFNRRRNKVCHRDPGNWRARGGNMDTVLNRVVRSDYDLAPALGEDLGRAAQKATNSKPIVFANRDQVFFKWLSVQGYARVICGAQQSIALTRQLPIEDRSAFRTHSHYADVFCHTVLVVYRPGRGNVSFETDLNLSMSDPFDILGLSRSFDLSIDAIERAYLAQSAQCHPDLIGDDDEASRRSAELNDAKAALANPESRANALLAVLGGPSKEQDRTLPNGFLLEMMETREEIEADIASGSEAKRSTWKEWSARERERYTKTVSMLFKQTPVDTSEIRKQLNAWRYIERLIEQLTDTTPEQSGIEGNS